MLNVAEKPRTGSGGPSSAPVIVVSSMESPGVFAREPVLIPTIDHDDAQTQYRNAVNQIAELVDSANVQAHGSEFDEHEYTVIQLTDSFVQVDRF